jgi:D-3-phosphoglycerate dehydrogenase
MFQIRTFNHISASGLRRFPSDVYCVADQVSNPDAIVLRSADLHQVELPSSLKAIGRAGAGVNNIPVERASARGIVVFNTPGANANAVKELVIAGMLLAARNISHALSFVQTLNQYPDAEKAIETEKKRFVGRELSGQTLGVVGLGAIGVKVANAARALGMRVLGLDPHMTVEGAWQLSADVIKASSLDELYAASDFISFHVPLNEATRGLFGVPTLATVKPGVVLLNFAREGIIDAQALTQGLSQGKIGRYVCDFPTQELLNHERVISLPHLGASTLEAEENCACMIVDQVREFLEHGTIVNSVNFPTTRMRRAGHARIAVVNRNVPNMIGQVSKAFGDAKLNIVQMHNASRGDYAYNLVDLETAAHAQVINQVAAIDGVLSVRVI